MRLLAALLMLAAATSAGAADRSRGPSRPVDWEAFRFPLRDSRPNRAGHVCDGEIVRIKYESPVPRRGAVLLIPGLFQNAFVFDLLPGEGISFARWLMREKGLQAYVLHPRGVGNSCYPKASKIDDIAIDDIPQAVEFVSTQLERDRIWVIGHSLGGLELQTALSGLRRCGRANCFDAETARERGRFVKGAAILGVNASMKPKSLLNQLNVAAWLDALVVAPARFGIDRIRASLIVNTLKRGFFPLTKLLREAAPSYWLILKYIYFIDNVESHAQAAFLEKAVDSTTTRVIHQYAVGLRNGNVRNSSGENFADHLGNIAVPVAQASYEFDLFAEPESAERENFDRIGSANKKHFVYPAQGHEDFLLNSAYHASQSDLIDWLLARPAAE